MNLPISHSARLFVPSLERLFVQQAEDDWYGSELCVVQEGDQAVTWVLIFEESRIVVILQGQTGRSSSLMGMRRSRRPAKRSKQAKCNAPDGCTVLTCVDDEAR